MDLRVEAARRIAALFGDGGATLLAEGNLDGGWAGALARVPDAAFLLPPTPPELVGERLLTQIRDHWSATGELRAAVAATRGIVKVRTRRLGDAHPDTLVEVGALGALADRAGRTEDARAMLESAHQALRAAVGGRDLRLAVVAGHLGVHYLRVERFQDAEAAFTQAYRIRREVAPDSTGLVAAQLAEMYLRSERAELAVPLLQEAHAQMRARFGPTHPRTVSRARALAGVLHQLGKHLEAEPVLRDLYQHAVEQGDPARHAEAAFDLGMGLRRVGLTEESYRHVEEAVALTRRLDRDPALPERLTAWARLTLERGRADEAEGLFREALEAETRLHGPTSVEVAVRYAELGRFVGERGRHAEAMGWLDPGARLLKQHLGAEHPVTRLAAENLVELLLIQARAALGYGDRGQARELKRTAEEWAPLLGGRHPLAQQLAQLKV